MRPGQIRQHGSRAAAASFFSVQSDLETVATTQTSSIRCFTSGTAQITARTQHWDSPRSAEVTDLARVIEYMYTVVCARGTNTDMNFTDIGSS